MSLPRLFALLASSSIAVACVPATPAGAPIPSEVSDTPAAAELQVITPEQAAEAGMVSEELVIERDAVADGTSMLDAWFEAAKANGATRVGEVAIYVRRASDDGLVECRTSLYPENTVEPHWRPGTQRLVSVTRPVTRSVTRYENRCRMVSKPVQRTETTYTTQYDSFSKRTRTVPQTRTVTRYESQNECRLEPVQRSETVWEYTTQTKYEPPRVEYLSRKRLRETEPVCYEASATPGKSRVVGKTYRLPASP